MEEQEKRDQSIKMAKRLRELRVHNKYSHMTLSKALKNKGVKVSHDSLMNYEVEAIHSPKFGANLRMRADCLLGLAKFYGVSTDYLLCVTDIRSPNPNVEKMVDYLGISEENICFLHAINPNTNEKGLGLSELRKGASTTLEEIINIVEGLSFASPEIGKTVVELIDKLISTIEEDFVNVLRLYHEIEKSAQYSFEQRKNHIKPEKILSFEEIFELNKNGFQIMDSSWIRKRSWEELLYILQSGVDAKMKQEIGDGKSVEKYTLGAMRPRKLSPQAIESLGINKGQIINTQINSGKKKK